GGRQPGGPVPLEGQQSAAGRDHRGHRADRLFAPETGVGVREVRTASRPLAGDHAMSFLWAMRPYFRQVAGQLVLGSAAGIVMNTAVVLPAILLGRAIDSALALERGTATPGDVAWAAALFIGGTLLTEVPRIAKRWWL